MNPNILLDEAPRHVNIDGNRIPISSSFRTGIQAMKLTDDPEVSDEDKARTLLFLYFSLKDSASGHLHLPKEVAEHPSQAITAALEFFNLNEPKPPENPGAKPAAGTRVFDWDWDAGRVIADFQREYRIDLSSKNTNMHWWRFWSLFRGLSESSQTMEAIRIRGAIPDEKKMGREAVAQLMRQKAALMLPARTQEEAMQLTNLRYRWALEF